MIKKLALTVIVVVMAGVGIGYLFSNSGEKIPTTPESSKETPANSAPKSPKEEIQKGVVDKQEKTPPTTLRPSSSEDSRVWTDFKYRADMDKYLGLRKKVLMAENEKREREELLADRTLIQSLQPLLLVEASKENRELQNAALDYLFEALQAGAKNEAAAVLRAVVADASVEAETTSLESRKALAGIKAEVLLNWSSLDPGAEKQIEASLPGRVSQKIWDRVKQHQDNNLAESATLQARK